MVRATVNLKAALLRSGVGLLSSLVIASVVGATEASSDGGLKKEEYQQGVALARQTGRPLAVFGMTDT